ncbi:MAG: LysM peptidoglycan-binding domain-containing protein, partial [Alistipes sp.]|nr:LysM peptidoglycan-binding domain-containing protein [Alistipes sp.]
MTMKRTCALLALLLASVTAFPIEKSGTVVYINGAKYYIHTVQPGETLYGLAKTYEVGEKVIVANNPASASGLKAGERLRIPFVSNVEQPASEKKLRKTFRTHEVAKGETLYAISRRYEIPIQTIVADNPSLDPIRLHPGDRILIRKQEEGSEDEAGSREQWEEYRQSLNSVADKGYAYHMVHPGETFYSLSRRFGLTEEELGRLNDGLRAADLKAGAIIKVPAPETAVAAAAETETQCAEEQPQTTDDDFGPAADVEFRSLRAGETLRAALLLPLDVAGQSVGTNYLEFYQGFLLGLQEAKSRYGCSVDLTLYNTARDSDRVAQIVSSPDFAGTQLIVGPVYEQALYPVVRYAERHAVPVVSPLAHIERMESPVLFQMASEPADKYAKA